MVVPAVKNRILKDLEQLAPEQQHRAADLRVDLNGVHHVLGEVGNLQESRSSSLRKVLSFWLLLSE